MLDRGLLINVLIISGASFLLGYLCKTVNYILNKDR